MRWILSAAPLHPYRLFNRNPFARVVNLRDGRVHDAEIADASVDIAWKDDRRGEDVGAESGEGAD